MVEVVAWVLGGIAGFWLVNRLLSRWLLRRVVARSYQNDMQRVLHGSDHRVKGRFE